MINIVLEKMPRQTVFFGGAFLAKYVPWVASYFILWHMVRLCEMLRFFHRYKMKDIFSKFKPDDEATQQVIDRIILLNGINNHFIEMAIFVNIILDIICATSQLGLLWININAGMLCLYTYSHPRWLELQVYAKRNRINISAKSPRGIVKFL